MRSVFITTGYDCDLNCLTCPAGGGGANRDSIQPQLQTLLSHIAECRKDQIYLVGGDPTLRNDLPQIIEAASMNGNHVSLYTSGVRLMDRKFILILTKAGLKHMSVPVFSHAPDIHDKITRTKTSFVKTSEALKNILYLKKNGHKIDVEIPITLTSLNYADLPRTVAHIAAEFMPRRIIIVQPEVPGEITPDIRNNIQPLLHAIEVCKRFRQDVSLAGVPLCWMDRAHARDLVQMLYSSSNVSEIVRYGTSSEKTVVPTTLHTGPCSVCTMTASCSVSSFAGSRKKHEHLSAMSSEGEVN
ncbi:MAG: radical SAM protein [Candidatus Methanoperedens sp.]|nr:radical SAM protein [Candidatus Methanoperedens sp.]